MVNSKITYNPSSMKSAVKVWSTVVEPSSDITKDPSPIDDVAGRMSERTRNIRPLVRPTATRS